MARKRLQFSEQLRAGIERSDKTRYRISKETGVAESVLCRFIHSKVGLSMESVDKLCECLGLRLVADEKPPRTRSTRKGG